VSFDQQAFAKIRLGDCADGSVEVICLVAPDWCVHRTDEAVATAGSCAVVIVELWNAWTACGSSIVTNAVIGEADVEAFADCLHEAFVFFVAEHLGERTELMACRSGERASEQVTRSFLKSCAAFIVDEANGCLCAIGRVSKGLAKRSVAKLYAESEFCLGVSCRPDAE
jgi:hypothetical protein